MTFNETLKAQFPLALAEKDYVRNSNSLISAHGFTGENTLACVSVCRDELTRSLVDAIQVGWGEAFNFSSLAGMIFAGKTGMGAALAHAPIDEGDGRERYVFFAMPHIGIGQDGTIGKCERHGRPGESSACGALAAAKGELDSGTLNTEFDATDVEQSLLKSRLASMIGNEKPSLLELTETTHDAILKDLQTLIDLMIDTDKADYAVFTGIQIHGPDHLQMISPRENYAVVNGQRIEITRSDVTN